MISVDYMLGINAAKMKNEYEKMLPKFCTVCNLSVSEINDDDDLHKNLRELSQPQERFAPKFKRNQEKIYF